MDRITQNLLNEFVATQAIAAIPQDQAFEHFANYSVLYNEMPDTFELDEVAVGADGNIGIDGILISVNGSHVTTEQDIDSIIKANGFLDADFVFVQAKTSSSFDLGDMGKFVMAVKDFFNDSPSLPHNLATLDLIRVKNHIYGRSGDMAKRNPNVALFYVCTGKWVGDRALQVMIDNCVFDLKQTQLFNEVKFIPIDASRLQQLYRATKGKATAQFNFVSRVALPQQIAGVKEAHFGLVPAREFLNIIVENGNIKKSLFYDNVRDFQDFNDVNRNIRATLSSTDRKFFPLLNNGVTIIAAAVRPTGNVFHIEDYQIVNGCQTSYVVFHEQSNITDEVFVPIKIICTNDDEIVNKIIRATNSQTQVKPDQLFALSEFQKTLEEYYKTFTGEQRLYYERRSKQYAGISSVEKVRVVAIQNQIRVFVSMFLNEPHRGHYPRSVGSYVGRQLFGRDHVPDPYYLSAFAHFRLEYFFRNGKVDKRYKPARYHLLCGARQILKPRVVPNLSANEMKRFCASLLPDICNDNRLIAAFQEAAAVVDQVRGRKALDRKLTKTQPFSRTFEKALLLKYPVQKKSGE